jgi:hypothetical protein
MSVTAIVVAIGALWLGAVWWQNCGPGYARRVEQARRRRAECRALGIEYDGRPWRRGV